MADYGIKISKPGYDVKTAAVKDQIFNSEANSLKIFAEGTVSISVGDGTFSIATATATVAHNLGYYPFFLSYFKLRDSNKIWFQDSNDTSVLLSAFVRGTAYCDTTNLYLKVTNDNTGAFTAYGYYYIFIDKAYE